MTAPWITRFAPSPTGRLHLGHVHAAFVARERARSSGGKFFLRHEDLDQSRCRPGLAEGIEDDLHWLGLDWDGEAVYQSHRHHAHLAALEKLESMGVIYPCFCTRKHILEEVAAMGDAPQGPDGPLYPGICRSLDAATREAKLAEAATGRLPSPALRLDVTRAQSLTGPLTWTDLRQGSQHARPDLLGDVVLARRDGATSYHLAVTVDDAWQGITLVTRGEDLFPSTHVHRLLQALLNLPVPQWEHHGLVTDESGRRLAKRHDALAIATLRESGWTPDQVLAAARPAARQE